MIASVQGGIGVLLAMRMTWIAIFQNEKYKLLAESNRVNLTLVPPRRGWILDRKGAPLASNKADFRVDLIPDRLVDANATVDEVGKLLQLTAIDIQDLKDKLGKAQGFQPVEAASGLDWEQFRRSQRALARPARRRPAARHFRAIIPPARPSAT